MRKRKARDWSFHEEQLATFKRPVSALRNTYSRHLAPWQLGRNSEEDIALRRLPVVIRKLLLNSMLEVMPPSEILQQIDNRMRCDRMTHAAATDFMLNTLVLMQLAFLMEHYGNEHPNVERYIVASNNITARNT